MKRSGVGEKRPRDTRTHNKAFKFIPGLRLSQHPPEQRMHLFLNKLDNIVIAKSLHPTEFEGYTIRERFVKMGWEQLLNLKCDKIYRRVVIQWTSTLSRNGDKLTGIVDGKSYTITPVIIRDLLGVDTRTDLPYARFNVADLLTNTDENKIRWHEACNTVFGVAENAKMSPLMQILWRIGLTTFHPRFGNMYCSMIREIRLREIYLCHAVFTGKYLYSFAHLMIDDIWDMYEHENQKTIPHGYYISEILHRLGAVSEDDYAEVVSPQDRQISRTTFLDLKFSESHKEYIINDQITAQRFTFPKKDIIEEVSPPFPQAPPQMPAHMDMTQSLTNLQNLIDKQLSQSQKQHSEMITIVTNIQKQIERLASETERREQERDKRSEIRAHAIIWDIERQRYFYEKEQEKLQIAWNQVNGVGEFQFPQISRTSFHPPQEGSRYYDPDKGDEIPKEFQSMYNDIYGPSR